MTHLNKIQQFSSILEKLLLAALIIIPLADAFFWFFLFGNNSMMFSGTAINIDIVSAACIQEVPMSQFPDGVKEGEIMQGIMSEEEMQACLDAQPLPVLNQWLGYVVNLLPLAVQLFAIWWLRKLFKNYAQGNVFTIENVRCYRMLSYGLLAWFFVLPVHELLFSLVLMIGQDVMVAETMLFGFGFGSANFLALLVGFALLIMSFVMEAAHNLEQESRMTI